MQDEARNIRRTTLSNGLIVLSERMEHVRSVSLGIWVRTGSRHERPQQSGISHFVEHMVFKGTRRRSAKTIAREVDSIGGNLDAFTGKETICFNVKVLDEHMPAALDVLADLVLDPVFQADDIERERGVVLEEIKIDEDNPDYLVHEIFTRNFWKGHPLGNPILGTRQTVGRFVQPTLFRYYGDTFRADNLIVSAAGNLEHDAFVERIRRYFESVPAGADAAPVAPPPVPHPQIVARNKRSLKQVQICLGVPAPPIASDQRYVGYILNTVLGGGMSSRLFQSVREDLGLAYAINSEMNAYKDTGCLAVYVGTSAEWTPRVMDAVVGEFRRLKREPVPADELRRAKDQLKGNILLSLESSNARMSNLARQEMYFQRFITTADVLRSIESVTADDVQSMARQLFEPERIAVTMLGNLEGVQIGREQLVC